MTGPANDPLDSPLLPFALLGEGAHVRAPRCCGQPMADDGNCGQGCCDDYCCAVCGKAVRVEWPD